MSRLERRCRLLLRAYPQPYRTERGAEILATLLDVAPAGRRWPPAREAWSLVTCGLRVRAAANRQLPLVTNLRLTALLAAAIWLSRSVATYQGTAFEEVVTHQWLTAAPFVLCALAACLAIHSAWFWRRSVTAALALAVPAALVLASGQVGGLIGTNSVVPPLALAVLVIGKNRPPRSWLWIPAAVLIAQVPGLLPYSFIWWWPLAFIPLPATALLGGLVRVPGPAGRRLDQERVTRQADTGRGMQRISVPLLGRHLAARERAPRVGLATGQVGNGLVVIVSPEQRAAS